MALFKFMVMCGSPILAWLILSQIIAWMITPNEDRVMDTWANVFLAPILLAYLLVAWLQMECKYQMYLTLRLFTLGKVHIRKPSQKIGDYIP